MVSDKLYCIYVPGQLFEAEKDYRNNIGPVTGDISGDPGGTGGGGHVPQYF